MRNLKIRPTASKSDVVFWLVAFAAFRIPYFNTVIPGVGYVYLLLRIGILAWFLTEIILSKWKVTSFDVAFFLFSGLTLVSTLVGHGYLSGYLKDTFELVFFYVTARYGLRRKPVSYIKSFSWVLLLMTMCNSLTVIIKYPEPLYSPNGLPFFLLGGSNTSVRLYAVAVVLCILDSGRTGSFLKPILALFSMFILVTLNDIGSGKICFVVLFFCMIYVYGLKQKLPVRAVAWIFWGHLIFSVLLLLVDKLSVFRYIIEELLHKDITLTNRTIIWNIVFQKIAQKPLLGYGVISGDEFESMLPHIIGVNAHNTLFMIMFTGGILLTAVFLWMFWLAHREYDRKSHSRMISAIAIGLFSLMFHAQVEGADDNLIIYLLFMLYEVNRYEDCIGVYRFRRKNRRGSLRGSNRTARRLTGKGTE